MDLPWLMCRYVNHTAKVSSTSSSRSLNCFRIFFTGNRSIFAAAASSAAAKRECQLLLSLALHRQTPDVTMSYLQQPQIYFASKFLISQCHICISSRIKVRAAQIRDNVIFLQKAAESVLAATLFAASKR